MAARMAGIPQQNFNLKSAQQKQQSQGLKNQVSFKSQEEQFKNPVNKNMERTLAATGTTLFSLAAGGAAFFFAKSAKASEAFAKRIMQNANAKPPVAAAIGAATALFVGLNTIPGAIYQANKSATVQKENMETFHAGNETELAVQGRMKEDSKDPNISTSELVNNFFKVQSAKNGKTTGLIVSQ